MLEQICREHEVSADLVCHHPPATAVRVSDGGARHLYAEYSCLNYLTPAEFEAHWNAGYIETSGS